MADQNGRAEQIPNHPDPALTELVRERVAAVHRAQERRAGATRPRIGRRGRPARTEATPTNGDSHASEVHALKSVFRQFGELHRQYRERTNEPTGAALRAAALAFKQEPSLGALVAVAGYLDELELLRP